MRIRTASQDDCLEPFAPRERVGSRDEAERLEVAMKVRTKVKAGMPLYQDPNG